MHCDRPKQFLEIERTPVITYPLRTFQSHDEIDKIYVVCAENWSNFVTNTALRENISKFARTLPAGITSMDSIRNGIKGIREDAPASSNPIVMLHEAVRPLLTAEMISINLSIAQTHGNAITATRSNEAYMVSTDGTTSTSSLPREQLYRAQTPQTFFLNDIEEAFARADRQGLTTSQSLYTLMTEVCGEKPLYIAQGSELNFKLTIPEDIETLKAILSYRKNS